MSSNEKLQFLGERGNIQEWIPFAVFMFLIVSAIVFIIIQQRDEKTKKLEQRLKNNPKTQSSVYPSHYPQKKAA